MGGFPCAPTHLLSSTDGWRALVASWFCFNRLHGAPNTPPTPLPGSAHPSAEPTLPVNAIKSASEPPGGGAMAGPDRGGFWNDPSSPGGRQFKIMIDSARPNRSYTQHISRRLNMTHEPLQTSHQACAQTAPRHLQWALHQPRHQNIICSPALDITERKCVQQMRHTQALRRHNRKQKRTYPLDHS